MTLKERYDLLYSNTQDICHSGDIQEHLPVLIHYASKSDTVVELGVREGVSTTALLMGTPKRMISYDIQETKGVHDLMSICIAENVNWAFIKANDLKIEIPDCQLLMIDTLHTGEQLYQELVLHSEKASKWICLHDTVSFGIIGEDKKEGLLKAIERWQSIGDGVNWNVKYHYTNNNGLMILERS
jgi:hypothetical protein